MASLRERISPGVVFALSLAALLLFLAYSFWSGPDPAMGAPPSASFIPEEERNPLDLSGTLRTLDGQRVTLEQYRDKLLFLNLWATWCGPCRAEMPSMASLHERLASKGLSIVAVTDESPEAVKQYLERNPYPFTVLIDEDGILMRRFGIQVLPTTLIVDRKGQLAYRHQGAYAWDSPLMTENFRRLLGE